MEDIKVLSETVDYDKMAWYNNPDPNFFEICIKSRVPPNWRSYKKVLNSKYKDSLIKPLNNYSMALIPRPVLKSIEGSVVTLRFYTFADFYVQWRDGELYNVDRPWIRQYYPTKIDLDAPDYCYEKTYKFYTPWFLDENIEVKYTGIVDEYSAFYVHNKMDAWHKIPAKIPEEMDFVNPHFVSFNFKKDGDHMKDENYGVIEWPHPMFDMSFVANDIIIERVKDFYANN